MNMKSKIRIQKELLIPSFARSTYFQWYSAHANEDLMALALEWGRKHYSIICDHLVEYHTKCAIPRYGANELRLYLYSIYHANLALQNKFGSIHNP